MIQFPRRLERRPGGSRTHIVVVGLPRRGWLEQGAFGLRLVHVGRENRRDRAGNFVLDCEDILQFSVIALGPAVCPSSTVDQLSANTDSVSATTNAALKSVPHAEFTPHLAHIHRFAFVFEARIASDYEQIGKT